MSQMESYAPSPVPADQRLWPGELPFTAFGQFGADMLDLRVFDQEVYWVDRSGCPHLLMKMSAEYVGNVIVFLEECCESFFVASIWRAVAQGLGDQILFGDPGGDVLAVLAGGPSWEDLTPQEWLAATPLMRALQRRAGVRD